MPIWTQKEMFPSIQEAIERVCKRSGVAKHKAIIDELLKDPEARAVIDRVVQRDSRRNQRAVAGNMIAWLSQKHTTVGLGEFSRRFDKQKDGHGTYTYQLAD
jgi:hypothetical protein